MCITNPTVYIIILNWNNWEDTIECLHSVYAMDYSNFKVIVIDNASENESVIRIKTAFPDLWLIENRENTGYTGGNNQGTLLALAEGADYVWLLNNDTVVETDTLSKIVDASELSPDIGMVSPVIYYYDDHEVLQFKGSKVNWAELSICNPTKDDESPEYSEGPGVCLWGTALLIKKSMLNKVGVLREDYFAYYEDTEYSLRAIQSGFRNKLVSNAKIYHKAPLPKVDGVLRNPYYYYYIIRNEHYMWKDRISKISAIYLFKHLLKSAINRAASLKDKGGQEHSAACIQAFFHALAGIRGKRPTTGNLPYWLVKVILWHPYFLLNLLTGDFKSMRQQISALIKGVLLNKE